MNKETFTEYIEQIVETHFDAIFVEVHTMAATTHGDITPPQVFRLEALKTASVKAIMQLLSRLVEEQVMQNLSPEEIVALLNEEGEEDQ